MTGSLTVRGLTTAYGDIRVTWDVSLDAAPGRVTALLGRNGAGKTSTLRAVAGLNRIVSGSVELDGHDVTGLAAYKRVALGLAYIQEGKRVFRRRTVEENLVIGAYSKGRRGRRDTARQVETAFNRFPILADRRNERAGVLSGGQQQMLAIAQALMSDPCVVLLDEPSAGLAPAIVEDVFKVIQTLQQDGLGIVLVEQSVDFALALADEVNVLDLGRSVYATNHIDEQARAAVEAAYFGAQEASP